jgi:hypothetical protein
MHELRLVGVHEDGRHVLLADPTGQQYRLPLDEALRAATLRDRARLGQLQIEIEGGLRPAEVQALIRRGLSTEEVAGRAGWPVDKVRRYEGPVLAEREYIAGLARKVLLGAASTRTTLEDRVVARLRDRGVEREGLSWDSARGDDGLWMVTAVFPAGGRERSATWLYDHVGRSLTPRNDEARWLSQDEVPGPIPAPHVATSSNRPSSVYDVEAEGGVGAGAPRHTPGEPIDLMAAMREHSTRGRRGRRRGPAHTPGDDAPRVDALPLAALARDPEQAPPPPAAREAHPESAHLDLTESAWPDDVDVGHSARPTHEPAFATESPAPGDKRPAEPVALTQPTDPAEPAKPDRAAPTAGRGKDTPHGAPRGQAAVLTTGPSPVEPRPPGRRGGRTSVPSWDDIMFGTRSRGAEAD